MLSTLQRAPFALACWLGVAGRDKRRGARILIGHGTPRRAAGRLERQLRYLRRHFDVVPLEQLIRRSASADRLVALTFDDGLKSNVQVAYPILRELGLPATFFVCPRLMDEGRWIWTHEARWRMRRLGLDEGRTIEWMKALDGATRRSVEHGLRRATQGLEPTPADREEFDLASWEDLRGLDPAIVTVGSHTLTHPMLSSSAPAELEAEVGESRRDIEARLQRPAEIFCYPNGDYSPAVLDCVRRHYRAAVTDQSGAIPTAADPHLLPRICLPEGTLRLASRMHRVHA